MKHDAEPFTPIVIELEADFWRLIWQSIDLLRFLTPVGSCRTLRCVVDRLNSYHVSLEELALPHARPDITRNTQWFLSCVEIARDFDWHLFQRGGLTNEPIQLRIPNVVERSECPDGTWYIKEGVHRTLVAAVLLDQRRIEWRPFQAVVMTPI
jgi:hypothetical protein